MNKKLAFLIGILAIFAIKMTAQDYKYGIYLGVNGSNMNITSDLYYYDSEPFVEIHGTDTTVRYLPVDNASLSPNYSFTMGGLYEVPVSDKLGLQLHLIYNRYGYTIKGVVDHPNIDPSHPEFSREDDYQGKLKISNLCASILLKYDLPSQNLSIQAGVTPSLIVRMQKDVEFKLQDQDQIIEKKTINYKKDEYNPLNICGTIGASYYLLDNIMISLTANFGLTNVLKIKEPYYQEVEGAKRVQYKYTDTKSTTNSVALTVGYRF